MPFVADLRDAIHGFHFADIADSLQSGSREWHPSGGPRRTYNLLFVFRGHTQGHFPVEGAV